jgi:hypothetical protein
VVACTTQEAPAGGTGGKTTTGGTGGKIVTTTGTGGGAGSYTTNDGVLCPLPMQALITDFTVVPPDAGAPDPDAGTADGGAADAAPVAMNTVHFGGGLTLGGSEFVYPTAGNWPVTSDVSGGNWHMTAANGIGDYSGFGLYFDNCSHVDASAYSGISFTISGSVLPPGGIVTMNVATLDDQIAASWLLTHGGTPAATDPGRCIPTSATATNQYNQSECASPAFVVNITATPTKVTIPWASFTTGKPMGVLPGNITGISWFFPPPTGAGTTTPTPYPVDITIDDLSFIAP